MGFLLILNAKYRSCKIQQQGNSITDYDDQVGFENAIEDPQYKST